jgi:hypothetical protein
MMLLPVFAQHIYQDADRARLERQQHADQAWRAYYGALEPPLRSSRYNDNVQPNFAQVVVDLGVSFLFGKDLPFEVADADGSTAELTESPAEAWLERCWMANEKGATLIKLATNGGVCGHVFVKIARKQPKTAPYPRLVVLDPATITPHWTNDDIDDVWKFVQEWKDIDAYTGKAVLRQQITERALNGQTWTITDRERIPDVARWTVTNTEVWPFPFAPIEHCQNLPAPNEFWGRPDLESHLIDLQRAVSFLASNLQKTIRLHAHPKPWASGVSVDQIDASPDTITGLPPGAEMGYMQADAFQEPSIALYNQLLDALHEVAKVPAVAVGKLENVGQLSGLALQILYGPLLAKTNVKRELYGPMLRRINRALLVVGGLGDREVTVKWQSPLPQNSMEERQVALLDEQLGASRDTILTRLGYDAAEEAAKKRTESTEAIARARQAFDRGQGAFAEDADAQGLE